MTTTDKTSTDDAREDPITMNAYEDPITEDPLRIT